MKVVNTAYSSSVYFYGRTQSKAANKNRTVSANPVYQGVNTAAIWFSFGVALDYVSRKLSFFKSPMKNSLAINGTIGAAAGIYTGYKTVNHKE